MENTLVNLELLSRRQMCESCPVVLRNPGQERLGVLQDIARRAVVASQTFRISLAATGERDIYLEETAQDKGLNLRPLSADKKDLKAVKQCLGMFCSGTLNK